MHAQLSCPTLWDPMNCNPLGFSFHEIFQVRILEPVSSSRGSSWPRDQTYGLLCLLYSRGFFIIWAIREAYSLGISSLNIHARVIFTFLNLISPYCTFVILAAVVYSCLYYYISSVYFFFWILIYMRTHIGFIILVILYLVPRNK